MLLFEVTANVTASTANSAHLSAGVVATGPEDDRANCRQLSPALSEAISAFRPAVEPFARGTAEQPTRPVLTVAEPNASNEPMCLIPSLAYGVSAMAFTTWSVVSEPMPTRSRGLGGPTGSAWAVPVPKAIASRATPAATANGRIFLFTVDCPFCSHVGGGVLVNEGRAVSRAITSPISWRTAAGPAQHRRPPRRGRASRPARNAPCRRTDPGCAGRRRS